MKNTYNPEAVARCDAFIYHILTHAPEGVNIKAERKGETAHFYIMNAPAPLYDFTGYGSAVHHVKPNGENFCANENYDKIFADLRATLPIYKAAHGSERVEHVMHIGHPRRSFVPMAKNTPTPKRPKAAPVVAPAPAVVEVKPEKVAEVLPVEVKSVAVPAEVAPVVAPAVVEVKAVERRRLGLGCMVARLVVALLSLIIAGLRVAVAAIRLAERGRLGEIVATRLTSQYKAVRSFVAGRYIALLFAVARTCAAIRLAILSKVEAARLAIVGRCVACRSAVVSWWRGLCSAIVGRYDAICVAIRARVEAIRLAVAGRIDKAARSVQGVACWLTLSARKVDRLAYRLENL